MTDTDNSVSAVSGVSGRVGGDTKNTQNYVDGYNAGFQAAQDAIMEKLTTLTGAVEARDAEIQRMQSNVQDLEKDRDTFRGYWARASRSADMYKGYWNKVWRMYGYERRAKGNAVNQARRWKTAYDMGQRQVDVLHEQHRHFALRFIHAHRAKNNAVNQARSWKDKYDDLVSLASSDSWYPDYYGYDTVTCNHEWEENT